MSKSKLTFNFRAAFKPSIVGTDIRTLNYSSSPQGISHKPTQLFGSTGQTT